MTILKYAVYGFFLLALAPYLAAQGQPTPVFVATVERKSFTDDVEAVGTLKANENVELMSTVTERVTRINFKDSQRVRKGRLLVEMDAAEELAQKAEEEYRIKEARRQVERLKPLVKRGAASESLLDQQQRELKTAEARVRAIQSRINQRRIFAPFDGVVGLRDISVGAMVQPGTRITTLDDDSIMKLDFSVPEVFLASIKPGTKIISTAGAYPDETFEGEVSGIGSRIDPVTRSIQVRALLNNNDGKLKPGLLMRVVLKKNNRNALVIPEEALIPNGNQNYVLQPVKDGDKLTVERRLVTIGARRQGEVEVLSGVTEGGQVVTHGTLRANPGMPILIKAIQKGSETLTELLKQQTKGTTSP